MEETAVKFVYLDPPCVAFLRKATVTQQKSLLLA